jgi:hypothetical protein
MTQVEPILSRFPGPGPVTLTPSRWKLWLGPSVFAGGTVFSVYLLLNAIEARSSEIIYAPSRSRCSAISPSGP